MITAVSSATTLTLDRNATATGTGLAWKLVGQSGSDGASPARVNVPYNATAATLKSRLESLPLVDSVTVRLLDDSPWSWEITFTRRGRPAGRDAAAPRRRQRA